MRGIENGVNMHPGLHVNIKAPSSGPEHGKAGDHKVVLRGGVVAFNIRFE